MDKKILNAFQALYGVINKFYEDHDITLPEKRDADKVLNMLENKFLQIDKKYDKKKEKRMMVTA